MDKTEQTVGMVRPTFTHEEYHRDIWRSKDITVLICQRKTPDLIRLSLESLLSFYPDIPVLVVDGDSQDESVLYLRLKALMYANVKVWERPHNGSGRHTSHGGTMHEAIVGHIKTKYVLLLDSDIIVDRGGWIEPMLEQMGADEGMYALGSLMVMSRKSEATLPPEDEGDKLYYAHPSCSLIDREKYLDISETFTKWHDGQVIRNAASDHGSPLCWNMMGAADMGYMVDYFPVDKYVSHLSGASWQDVPTLWPNDHNVTVRPFVTFIVQHAELLHGRGWHDDDFDIVTYGEPVSKRYVVHGELPFDINSQIYLRRFSVMGEYICELVPGGENAPQSFVLNAKRLCAGLSAPDEFDYSEDGRQWKFIRRPLWQRRQCLGQQKPE